MNKSTVATFITAVCEIAAFSDSRESRKLVQQAHRAYLRDDLAAAYELARQAHAAA